MVFDVVQGVVGSVVDLDAVTGRRTERGTEQHPRLGRYRATDVSAALGGVCWIGIAAAGATGRLPLGEVELFVALALLVMVPLGLGLAATPRESGGTHRLYTLAAFAQFPGALLAVAALAVPVGTVASVVLVLPWVAITGLVALVGAWRLLSRGVRPIPELAVDAALFYVTVGAVALVLHRAGINLRFDPLIILLTAVHYHYAGFVLPLVAGLAGRRLTGADGRFERDVAGRVGLAATLVIIVNLVLIAVGITFSPSIEVVAVAFFTVAVAVFALFVLARVVPTLERGPAVLLGIASVSIVGTMALALAYGYSAFPATGRLLGIGEMVRWHGTLNAFGFALPALLAFRITASPGEDDA